MWTMRALVLAIGFSVFAAGGCAADSLAKLDGRARADRVAEAYRNLRTYRATWELSSNAPEAMDPVGRIEVAFDRRENRALFSALQGRLANGRWKSGARGMLGVCDGAQVRGSFDISKGADDCSDWASTPVQTPMTTKELLSLAPFYPQPDLHLLIARENPDEAEYSGVSHEHSSPTLADYAFGYLLGRYPLTYQAVDREVDASKARHGVVIVSATPDKPAEAIQLTLWIDPKTLLIREAILTDRSPSLVFNAVSAELNPVLPESQFDCATQLRRMRTP